jgi:hypothetical protein
MAGQIEVIADAIVTDLAALSLPASCAFQRGYLTMKRLLSFTAFTCLVTPVTRGSHLVAKRWADNPLKYFLVFAQNFAPNPPGNAQLDPLVATAEFIQDLYAERQRTIPAGEDNVVALTAEYDPIYETLYLDQDMLFCGTVVIDVESRQAAL